jgi:hypothetical protein
MSTHHLAGKAAPKSILVNVPELISAYFTLTPDVRQEAERVSFGTSGHRGSSLKRSFNEQHILAVTQAVCEYRVSPPMPIPVQRSSATRPPRLSPTPSSLITKKARPSVTALSSPLPIIRPWMEALNIIPRMEARRTPM